MSISPELEFSDFKGTIVILIRLNHCRSLSVNIVHSLTFSWIFLSITKSDQFSKWVFIDNSFEQALSNNRNSIYRLFFRWTHFEDCIADEEVVASTNSSEGINSCLNEGFKYAESLIHQISHVKKWKIRQIERWNELTTNQWVPGRRPKTIERHQSLSDMVGEFMNLGVINQHDMLIEVSMNIGRLMSKTHQKMKK